MDNLNWYHIQFSDGSNPYICKSEKELKRIQKKYNLVKIKDNFYKVY